jgi:probable HAF family extracellular repeat protein
MVSLGALGGGDSSRAHGINDQGHVVGESATRPGFAPLGPLSSTDPSLTQPLTASRAFLWTEGTGMRDLGSLGGDSVATAINNQNVVVGYSALTDGPASPHGGHAFRWTAEGGMIDLNDLLPPWSDWELLNAYDINDKGQIVGSGRIDGQIRAYRLSRVRLVFDPT